ncbi:hypothetical protein MW7_005960 [Imbroritus primus]|uniref:Uncharacterized protein n=2 Tax=Imbroritus primus TaxID=3058603 RepID=A0ACD3SQ37_9BURK|nr:hypothetical protein MW7_005960 [Burkholderiaceae bacterium PBA]
MTRRALSAMKVQKNGVIVNIIGIVGVSPKAEYIAGCTTNAALRAFTHAVGGESRRLTMPHLACSLFR